jgi:hypothetical protein
MKTEGVSQCQFGECTKVSSCEKVTQESASKKSPRGMKKLSKFNYYKIAVSLDRGAANRISLEQIDALRN